MRIPIAASIPSRRGPAGPGRPDPRRRSAVERTAPRPGHADGAEAIPRELEAERPRLPLPPLTADGAGEGGAGGLVASSTTSRMRRHYLPPELAAGGERPHADSDPAMTLGNPFQTMLFWIVSRGEQLHLLHGPPGEQARGRRRGGGPDRGPRRRLVRVPMRRSGRPSPSRASSRSSRNAIGRRAIEGLRRYYNDRQVLEIILAVSNFNAMNRWTGGPERSRRSSTAST